MVCVGHRVDHGSASTQFDCTVGSVGVIHPIQQLRSNRDEPRFKVSPDEKHEIKLTTRHTWLKPLLKAIGVSAYELELRPR